MFSPAMYPGSRHFSTATRTTTQILLLSTLLSLIIGVSSFRIPHAPLRLSQLIERPMSKKWYAWNDDLNIDKKWYEWQDVDKRLLYPIDEGLFDKNKPFDLKNE
ncbi:hypothetical protein AB6A40_007058 [Gnathostoma spinigerum]|uniref:Uncharacterized protein n=1 Tax=Gnathostoma spinigerum TaxID=75299 RepID=A0ABD6EQ96_9BILA